MKVKLNELKHITTQALLNLHYTAEEAASISDVLLYAQMRGNNQGIVKLTNPEMPKTDNGPIEVVKETKVSALLDAHQNHAMIVANRAVDIAVAKAKEHGIVVVGARGIKSSSGALGYYVRRIAREGLVGMMFVSAPPVAAPAGSFEAMLGTNPLAIGVPGKQEPLVLDMATAAMALYGVIEASTAGTQLPPAVAYDKEGHDTTNPDDMLDGGALRTFGDSYKSSGLSMMVQILAGPLVGTAFMGEGDMKNNWAGDLLIAIDPDILNGTERLRDSVEKITAKIKDAKKLPGVDEIFIPSERGDRMTGEVEASGEIEIEDNLWRAVKKVAGA